MATRDRPGWAEPVPDHGDRIVRCPGCGRTMKWRRFLEHGPECDGDDEGEPTRETP